MFSERGKILVGTEGCSQYFMMGMLEAAHPDRLSAELTDLHTSILADPYFRNVPSILPQAKKTWHAFHAKDDLPEIRREVFQLLRRHDLRFYAVIRNKSVLLDYVLQRNQIEPGYRYNPKEQYDLLVSRLFHGHLHRDDSYRVLFSRRYKGDRTAALKSALVHAQDAFNKDRIVRRKPEVQITACSPKEHPCLQATDYLLWALQRAYERRESRYLEAMMPAIRLIHDVDDKTNSNGGEYYTQKRPLIIAAGEIKPGI